MKKIIVNAGWYPDNMGAILSAAAPTLVINSTGSEAGAFVAYVDRELSDAEIAALRAGYLAALPVIGVEDAG